MEIFLWGLIGVSMCWVAYLLWRFFWHTRQFHRRMRQFQRTLRLSELQLARVIVKNELSGAQLVDELTRIAEAEREVYDGR